MPHVPTAPKIHLRPAGGRLTRLLALTAAVLVACCTPALSPDANAAGKTEQHELRSGLLTRSYQLYVPAGYQPGKPAPLIVAMHGGMGTGEIFHDTIHLDGPADRHGFLVAYPDGYRRAWNAGTCCGPPMESKVNDVGFIRDLIADIKSKYAVDAKRVYGTGFSNGAMLAHRIACEAPDTFTAIAPVSGGIMIKTCKPPKGLPILFVQGREDPRIPWDGGIFQDTYRPSIRELVADFGKRDGCSSTEKLTKKEGPATCMTLQNCSGGSEVSWCGVAGVGHQWAGGKTFFPRLLGQNTTQFSATAEIVDFFLRH